MEKNIYTLIILLFAFEAFAQYENINDNKFKQLKEEMATLMHRTAGALLGILSEYGGLHNGHRAQ